MVRAQFSMAKCGPDFDWVGAYLRFFFSQRVDGMAESLRCCLVRGFVE